MRDPANASEVRDVGPIMNGSLMVVATLVLCFSCGGGGGGADLAAPDLDGRDVAPLDAPGAKAVVLLFLAPDCPIANAFAPEIERIHAEYAARDVAFHAVYADADVTRDEIRAHREGFSFTMPALLDFQHELVDYTGATMTPEAAVLSTDGTLLYRGRIDDRYVDYGKQRAEPTKRDLRTALDAILAGRSPEVSRTETIGCFIPSIE